MRERYFLQLTVMILWLSTLCFNPNQAQSMEFRVGLIPNGSAINCAACHVSSGGGGTRNSFGMAVEALITPGSTQQFWSEALAAMDSDGDGFTNGEELQDPNGTWRPGQPAPGDRSLVTNPGNPNSRPAQVATPTPTLPPMPTATPTLAPMPTATPTPPQSPTSPGDTWIAVLSGANEVPPINTDARGLAVLRLHEPEGILQYWLNVFDIEGVTASHIHIGAVGENGGVRHPLTTPASGSSSGSLNITAEDLANLRSGMFYVNVHTEQNGGGEIRGQIVDEPATFTATLTGAQENPPVETQASGEATFMLSEDLMTLQYDITISNIENVTMAHIHRGAVGENGGVIFPLADSAFTQIDGSITLNDEQLADLLAELYYVNVHTTQNGGGEIRGQILFDDGDPSTSIQFWSLHE